MRCSFCVKEARDVRALVFRESREAICDECLAVGRDIIEDDSGFDPAALALPRPSEIDDFLARLPDRSWMQLRPLLPRATLPRKSQRPKLPAICNFCDVDSPGKLIAGPNAFICDRCVVEGTRLLEQGSRLVEFKPASRPGVHLDKLSDGQRDRVLDGVREELRRRRDALWSAMQLAAGEADVETAVIGDPPEVTIDADTLLPAKAREHLHAFAPTPIPLCIVGGTSQERRRLALRVHQLSNRPGRFVPIDCASPRSLARMREAVNGTLFLDDVPLLSAAAQELLGISLCDDPALRLSTRIVCAASEARALDSRIEQREFSEALSYDVRWVILEM